MIKLNKIYNYLIIIHLYNIDQNNIIIIYQNNYDSDEP